MSFSQKFKTARYLVRQGDFKKIAETLKINVRQLRIRGAKGRPFIHHRPGYRFVCLPEIADSREIYLQGNREDRWELDFLRAWLRPGDAMIDAGANLGLYAIEAAHEVGPSGRVLALEPSPIAFSALTRARDLLGLTALQALGTAVND